MLTRPILSRNDSKTQKKRSRFQMEVTTKQIKPLNPLLSFVFSHNPVDANSVGINIESLTDAKAEYWLVHDAIKKYNKSGVSVFSDEDFSFFITKVRNFQNTKAAAYSAYVSLFKTLKENNFQSPARIWNFIPNILSKDTEYDSSYQAFNAGRLEAWTEAGPSKNGRPITCAATGMGAFGDTLTIIFLATKYPVINVENPRQDSTINYPDEYGPKPPIFARASIVSLPASHRLLLLSGTGSIVGSKTVQIGNPLGQIKEIIRNVECLISKENLAKYNQSEFKLQDIISLRVYLKTKELLPIIKDEIESRVPQKAQKLYLFSEFCRPDLDVEIEAVFRN